MKQQQFPAHGRRQQVGIWNLGFEICSHGSPRQLLDPGPRGQLGFGDLATGICVPPPHATVLAAGGKTKETVPFRPRPGGIVQGWRRVGDNALDLRHPRDGVRSIGMAGQFMSFSAVCSVEQGDWPGRGGHGEDAALR